MIQKVKINNFKSIENLSLELGRVNIIIGANGSGKTNILEAIVMGAAASANKLDYEFLGNRMRITTPEFMRNAFPNSKENEINLEFTENDNDFFYELINDNSDYRKWIELNRQRLEVEYIEFYRRLFSNDEELLNDLDRTEELADELRFIKAFSKLLIKNPKVLAESDNSDVIKTISKKTIEENFTSKQISEFLIYTPELSFLKKFEEQAQITPLGVNGEGLFNLLKNVISNKRKTKQINDIKENLHLLDWFDDFDIPDNLMSNEFKIAIKDRFISEKLSYFDQRSSNEGFLYLLFYLVLFTSDKTPPFFAIDNIETGFNPKLCTELIVVLNKLAKKYNKQVIITTHNPAILDGINLNDDNQRLFIAQRNKNGKTIIDRIKNKPKSDIKLSELWTRGYIGGIPDNF